MRSKIIFSTLLLCFAFSTVSAIDPATRANQPSMNQPQNAQASQDGQILGIIIVLNKNEVAAANEAINRRISPMVRRYALMIRDDHGHNLRSALRLSRRINEYPVDSDESNTLKEQGQQQLHDFKTLNNREFQIAFINAMVKGHQEALNKLDGAIPNVTNPRLRMHLQNTRARIAMHLEKAKMIQNRLNHSSATTVHNPHPTPNMNSGMAPSTAPANMAPTTNSNMAPSTAPTNMAPSTAPNMAPNSAVPNTIPSTVPSTAPNRIPDTTPNGIPNTDPNRQQ